MIKGRAAVTGHGWRGLNRTSPANNGRPSGAEEKKMFRIDVLAVVLISEEHNDFHSSSRSPARWRHYAVGLGALTPDR